MRIYVNPDLGIIVDQPLVFTPMGSLSIPRSATARLDVQFVQDGSVFDPDESQAGGLLTKGITYKIVTYVSGDDFTNLGAASNATGIVFTATDETPTDWENESVLKECNASGVTFALSWLVKQSYTGTTLASISPFTKFGIEEHTIFSGQCSYQTSDLDVLFGGAASIDLLGQLSWVGGSAGEAGIIAVTLKNDLSH